MQSYSRLIWEPLGTWIDSRPLYRSGTHTGSPPKASSGVGDLLKRACACLDEPRSVKMANKWEDIHAVASELLPSEAAYGLYRLGHMLDLMDAQKRSGASLAAAWELTDASCNAVVE